MRISDWSSDVCSSDLLTLDPEALARELGVPVVPTVAVRRRGIDDLKQALAGVIGHGAAVRLAAGDGSVADDIVTLQRRARAIAVAGTISETPVRRWTHAIDAVAPHPEIGRAHA